MIREEFVYLNRPLGGTITVKQRNGGGPYNLAGTWELRLYKHGSAVPFRAGSAANGKIAVNAGAGTVTRGFTASDLNITEGYGSAELIRTDVASRPLAVWPIRYAAEGTPFIDQASADIVIYQNDVLVAVEGASLLQISSDAAAAAAAASASAASAAATVATAETNLGRSLYRPAFPLEPLGRAISTVPKPPSGFALDWPEGQADTVANDSYMFSADGFHGIGFSRELYASAIMYHARVSDGWQAIMNNGAAGSGLDFTDGGMSKQPAVFFRVDDLHNGTYEDKNEIIGSYQNRDTGNRVYGVKGPHLMRLADATTMDIQQRFARWFDRRYRGNRIAATSANAANLSLSEGIQQLRLRLNNILTPASPLVVQGSLSYYQAYRRDDEADVLGYDIMACNHNVDEVPEFWEYDPRTGASARTYPSMADSLVVQAIAAVNRNLVGELDVGDVVTMPSGATRTLQLNDYVLLRAQTAPAENGVVRILAGGPSYVSVPPPQVYGLTEGYYTKTDATTWIRTFNYGCKPGYVRNAAGTKAYGWYSWMIPLTGWHSNSLDGVGCGQYHYQQYEAITKVNAWQMQLKQAQLGPSFVLGRKPQLFAGHSFIGTETQVKAGIQAVFDHIGKLTSPNVVDPEYWRKQNPHLAEAQEHQILGDWVWHGCNENRIGKAGQSLAGKPGGWTSEQWWRSLA